MTITDHHHIPWILARSNLFSLVLVALVLLVALALLVALLCSTCAGTTSSVSGVILLCIGGSTTNFYTNSLQFQTSILSIYYLSSHRL
jgi:hypothetical protein